MVALLRRNLAKQPPSGSYAIDWGHPLAQGLVLHAVFHLGPGAEDVVTGYRFTPVGTPRNLSGPGVQGLASTSSGNSGGRWATFPNIWPETGSVSVVWNGCLLGDHSAGGGGLPIFAGTRTTTPANVTAVRRRSGSQTELDLRYNSGGTQVTEASSGAALSSRYNRPLQIVGVRAIGDYNAAYVDAERVLRTTANVSASSVTANTVEVGGDANDLTAILNGYTSRVALYSRPLSHGEVAWLHVEPYAFITRAAAARSYFMLVVPALNVNVSHALAVGWATPLAAVTHDAAVGAVATANATATATATHDTPIEAAATANAYGLAAVTHDATVEAAATVTATAHATVSADRDIIAQAVALGASIVEVTVDRTVGAIASVVTYGRALRTITTDAEPIVTALWREPHVPLWREPHVPLWREPHIPPWREP